MTAHRTAHHISEGPVRHIKGVPVMTMQVKDYYGKRRYRLTRQAVRLLHGMQERYLRNRPDTTFSSKHNLARDLIYSMPGIRAWAGYMPGGYATLYAHSPHYRRMKNGKRLDPITAAFFRHSFDAVGLRSRSHIMGWLIDRHHQSFELQPLRWMSIAGGTGKPVFDALHEIPPFVRRSAVITLTDMDDEILAFAKELYELESVDAKKFTTATLDVLQPHDLKAAFERYRPTAIDAMGLMEYLDDRSAVAFLKSVYHHMIPGSVLVFTNMTHDHPHLEVHRRALGWPGVIQRSAHDMLDIAAKAGIPTAETSVYHDQDKVYNVYQVAKP